jgi:transcriptional regulator with XRE-family HTH domain
MHENADYRAFGDTLKRARTQANKTLQDLANALEVTVGYMSDVERGRRHPLKPEAIEKVCEVVGEQWKGMLYDSAIKATSVMSVTLNKTRGAEAHAAAALLRRWNQLSPAQFGEISRIVEKE